ncbi:DUF3775 domain-containing protein [Wenxinia saemankumensis]|uniref:DUF3775 domain-containing protein n=1 Tax=Wenxinia saemankumensis TaxID=1447782 RepID=A0A1M6E5E5_9RHOB|nr:DUF3775 domain-containing protein [Wenxinia saemankumensis]SHI80726.1 Protein of unknown function [Wenxinia saemankumensis]
MIGISTPKVNRVIALGQEVDDAESLFDSYIEGLTEEEQAALIALMWVGRGDFDADDWEDALNTAMTDAADNAAEVLKEDEDFPDHLEAGLAEMAGDADDEEDEDDIPEGFAEDDEEG